MQPTIETEKKSSQQPTVSIIIPTFNRKTMLVRLLESIGNSSYQDFEVIVIDDASTDGTNKIIREKFPHVVLIRNKTELWASESRNVGINNARGEFLFFIDDDNVIDKNCIGELVEVMQSNPKIGCVGPIMYYFCDTTRIAWAGATRGKLSSLTRVFTDHPKEKIVTTDYIPNAFMTRKETAKKIGLFDGTNFPFHYDDGDFCQRHKKAGFKVVFTPNAKVWHDIALPEKVEEKTRLFHCSSEKLAFHNSRSRIIYQHKYTSRSEFVLFLILFNWLISLYYFKIILLDSNQPLQKKVELCKAYVRGILAGLQNIK